MQRSRPLAALGAALLALPLLAHEDDPKLLDRQPPFRGRGYRNAQVTDPGRFGLSAGSGSLFESSGVSLLAWLPLAEFGADVANGNDCWGYVSPSGREYALFGHSEGLAVVEVTNPGDPVIVANDPEPQSLWRDVKVFGEYAYAVSEGGGGIHVFDLSAVDAGVVTQVAIVNDVGVGATHNVAIDETSGFLYRCGGGGEGLRVYDLSNPAQPTYVGSWPDRYVHDAQVVTYTSGPYAGREIAYCCSGFNGGFGQTGLSVLDVTNKQAIVHLAQLSYSNPNYSHQCWLSPDRQLLYLNDELDEGNTGVPTTTHVIDVSDPASPVEVGTFTNGNSAVGHNLYTRGDLVYEANYRSGLRVFDVSGGSAATETAWFDTYPADDAPGFNGLWSVFPYFPSGTVIGSDMQRGLFVWRLGPPELAFQIAGGPPEFVDPSGATLVFSVTETTPGLLDPASVALHYDVGAGLVTVPATPLGGLSFAADLPARPCGEPIDYYLSAGSTSGIAWTDPPGAPAATHRAVAGLGAITLLSDEMEVDSGWTVGAPGDTATSGIWTRVDPVGTSAQPEDDHTPGGTHCWVTGQGVPGGSNGANDVDGGTTTLLSPVYDLSGTIDPVVSFWRWFSNDTGSNPGEDALIVSVSNDGGAGFVPFEFVGPGGAEAQGGWYRSELRVRDLFALPGQLQLRFEVFDLAGGSIVEAAIDDLEIHEVDCGDCNANGVPDQLDVAQGTSPDLNGNGVPDECECVPEVYCVAAPNSVGAGARIGFEGTLSLAANDLVLTVQSAAPGQFGLFFYGSQEVQVPFGDGFRCVGGGAQGIQRLLPPILADAFGDLSRPVDYGAPPMDAGPGAVAPGAVWRFQLWYRDPAAGGAGFNFSDALRATFCP